MCIFVFDVSHTHSHFSLPNVFCHIGIIKQMFIINYTSLIYEYVKMQSEFMTFQYCVWQIKLHMNINPTDWFTNKITWSAVLYNWIVKLW